MATLAKHFSLEDFISFFKKDFNKITEIEKFRLGNKAKAFLQELSSEGVLQIPMDNFNGHENKFLGALKRVVMGQDELEQDNEAFSQFLIFQIAGAYHFEGTLDEQYKNFIEGINTGEFFDIDFPRVDVCQKCNSTIALGAENWNFNAYAYRELRDENGLKLDHDSVKICPNQ